MRSFAGMVRRRWPFVCCTAYALLLAITSVAQEPPRQSLDDAWFTGPMLAASAATLPRGHMLIEPYFFDVSTQGRFDKEGTRRSATHANDIGTLTYINYGLTDSLTIGLLPTTGYNIISGGVDSSRPAFGDLTLNSQYRLRKYHPGSRIPMMSVNVQQTFPTAKFDRLKQMSDGFGGGAFTTNIGLYMQQYFWLPNRRILRGRLNISQAFSGDAKLKDASVYGTDIGFCGTAQPGASFVIDNAWEYSLTKRWVLATDVEFRHDANTWVRGYNDQDPLRTISLRNSGAADLLYVAPAVEYNLNSKVGVLLGLRLTPAGRNASASITPAIAINIVH